MLTLIIGGENQGKLAYARAHFNGSIFDGKQGNLQEVFQHKIINHLHSLVKRLLVQNIDPGAFILPHLKDQIVICNEIGGGVIPMASSHRNWREETGRLCCAIAHQSDQVYRIHCGIPMTLKDIVYPTLIRHGKTLGNAAFRYIGSQTDEHLSVEGLQQLAFLKKQNPPPSVKLLFSSPMARCIETAQIFYPNLDATLLPELKEMDFGEFDGLTYQEIIARPGFQNWNPLCEAPYFPGGELFHDFQKRCQRAFCSIIEAMRCANQREAAVCCHGGVIMAIMTHFGRPKKNFQDYRLDNGAYITLAYDLISRTAERIEPCS